MGEEEGCENRKSDVASLGRKLKLHPLVDIIIIIIIDRKLGEQSNERLSNPLQSVLLNETRKP